VSAKRNADSVTVYHRYSAALLAVTPHRTESIDARSAGHAKFGDLRAVRPAVDKGLLLLRGDEGAYPWCTKPDEG
jgi:hypothetical protein